jgi:hypothetical protein
MAFFNPLNNKLILHLSEEFNRFALIIAILDNTNGMKETLFCKVIGHLIFFFLNT